jgi:hypothetical protein
MDDEILSAVLQPLQIPARHNNHGLLHRSRLQAVHPGKKKAEACLKDKPPWF